MIDKNCLNFFDNFFDILKNTSKDKHDEKVIVEYMTNSDMTVINFDSVKQFYIKDLQLSNAPKSCDALVVNDGKELYLIEFKNGSIDNHKNYAIKKKLYDSLLVMLDIINKGISYSRQYAHYILVYNEDKDHSSSSFSKKEFHDINISPSLLYISETIASHAKEPFIQFGLEQFKKLYFKSVNTYTKEQFEKEFVDKRIN